MHASVASANKKYAQPKAETCMFKVPQSVVNEKWTNKTRDAKFVAETLRLADWQARRA